jgi:hypothetical protein
MLLSVTMQSSQIVSRVAEEDQKILHRSKICPMIAATQRIWPISRKVMIRIGMGGYGQFGTRPIDCNMGFMVSPSFNLTGEGVRIGCLKPDDRSFKRSPLNIPNDRVKRAGIHPIFTYRYQMALFSFVHYF